jgi:hypothetical protein
VTRWKRRRVGVRHERCRVGIAKRRARAIGELLAEAGERLAEQVGNEDERKDDGLPPQPDRQRCEHDPDEAPVPDARQRDEDRVERLAPVEDDPTIEPLV